VAIIVGFYAQDQISLTVSAELTVKFMLNDGNVQGSVAILM
jgi:hypothetical protein